MSTALQESRPKPTFTSSPPGLRVKVLSEHVGRHKTLALLLCLGASLLVQVLRCVSHRAFQQHPTADVWEVSELGSSQP